MRWLCLVLVALALVVTGASGAQPRILVAGVTGETPLVGADLVNTDPLLPHCWDGSIVPDYGKPGVRARMQKDLAAMRAAGLQSFRIFLYHEHGDSPAPLDIYRSITPQAPSCGCTIAGEMMSFCRSERSLVVG